ncbi:MAG: periplasmic heavy metal sensor [Pyrinomonadaceae bacterium]|nr:periplasmic heavy metal sensor [Pyrinomonadaceae bacterium]
MKLKTLIFALMTVSLFGIGAAVEAQAQPPGGNNFDGAQNRGAIIARVLGLSDEQKMQIRQINRRQRLALRDAQQQLADARAEADLAIYANEYDEELIGEKIRKVAVAQAEITKIRLMSEVAVRNVLSPEQLVKFRDLRKRFQQQRRQRQQRRRDRPARRQRKPADPDVRL